MLRRLAKLHGVVLEHRSDLRVRAIDLGFTPLVLAALRVASRGHLGGGFSSYRLGAVIETSPFRVEPLRHLSLHAGRRRLRVPQSRLERRLFRRERLRSLGSFVLVCLRGSLELGLEFVGAEVEKLSFLVPLRRRRRDALARLSLDPLGDREHLRALPVHLVLHR